MKYEKIYSCNEDYLTSKTLECLDVFLKKENLPQTEEFLVHFEFLYSILLDQRSKEFIAIFLENLLNLNDLILLLDQEFDEIIIHSENQIQKIPSSPNYVKINYLPYLLEILVIREKQEWNAKHVFVSFQSTINSQKYRISLIHPSINNGNPKAFFRKNRTEQIGIEQFNFSSEQLEFLKGIIQKKMNILITGMTSSGKTTLLNCLTNYFNNDEHIICIEDTREIQIDSNYVTYLLSDENNNQQQLLSYSLRMSPSRTLIGEIRGSEVDGLITNLNTGQKGVISTLHANSAVDSINRLINLYAFYSSRPFIHYDALKQTLVSQIDIVIHMENKRILEVILLKGLDLHGPIYEHIEVFKNRSLLNEKNNHPHGHDNRQLFRLKN